MLRKINVFRRNVLPLSRVVISGRGKSSSSLHSEKFEALIDNLNEKGWSVGGHVMSATTLHSEEDAGKCPFLATHPLLMRTALRETNARTYARRFPLCISKAKGSHVWDDHGNEYIDCLVGAGTLNLGHNHPVVVDAAKKFLDSGHPMQLLDISSPAKDEFVSELLQCLPQNMKDRGVRFQFCSPAGTDVVEAAMKLAKKATGRVGMMAFQGGYHGHTQAALSLMGNLGPKQVPGIPGHVQFLPYPYAYRCPFGIGEKGHEVIAYWIDNLLSDVEGGVVKPAAIILEAVQGEAGIVPAEVEFLKKLREVSVVKLSFSPKSPLRIITRCYYEIFKACASLIYSQITEKHDILLILDEIQAGIARTGKMLAFEHSGIVPDMVCLSKAVGGGMPMGVLVYSKKLDERNWTPGSHAGTFRGNQLAMATGAAALRFTRETDLMGDVCRKGAKMMEFLLDLKSQCKYVGDVRGKGMMIGLELVDADGPADKLGSYAPYTKLAVEMQTRLLTKGILMERGGRGACVMRFLMPLITSEEEIGKILHIFKET